MRLQIRARDVVWSDLVISVTSAAVWGGAALWWMQLLVQYLSTDRLPDPCAPIRHTPHTVLPQVQCMCEPLSKPISKNWPYTNDSQGSSDEPSADYPVSLLLLPWSSCETPSQPLGCAVCDRCAMSDDQRVCWHNPGSTPCTTTSGQARRHFNCYRSASVGSPPIVSDDTPQVALMFFCAPPCTHPHLQKCCFYILAMMWLHFLT